MKSLSVAVFYLFFAGVASVQANESSSGSGIAIGAGDILTNWHVVNGCSRIVARTPTDVEQDAILVARDERNDLAVIRVSRPPKSTAVFRQGGSVRAGETVVASGYPLSGLLASTANVSTGIVNALAGLADDSRFLQISAPVQPGNSGGPLVDQAGRVIGIVTSKLDAVAVAQVIGDIPQNVNFAIKAEIAKTFLESQGIKYAAAVSDQQLSLPDVADIAKSITAYIECRGESSPSVATESRPKSPAPPIAKKFNDRIASSESRSRQLYEEDPKHRAGKRYVGSAVWRTATVTHGANQPLDVVVRADIDIPDRKMTMKWTLQRNLDKTLPASHTVEVVYKLPPNFPYGGIQKVPGVLMKDSEQTRGMPLAGLVVKVTDGYFLMGLSAVDVEMQRNIELLKSRPWFDVPLVYTDGRRAILAVEKGPPGERAFRDAFAAWKQ
jgi:hypothetical protein